MIYGVRAIRGSHQHEVRGLAMVSRATGLALNTVKRGRNELRAGAKTDHLVNVREKGSGGLSLPRFGGHPGYAARGWRRQSASASLGLRYSFDECSRFAL